MRLYSAICAWIEAKAFEKLASAGNPDEPQAEGNNFPQIWHAQFFERNGASCRLAPIGSPIGRPRSHKFALAAPLR